MILRTAETISQATATEKAHSAEHIHSHHGKFSAEARSNFLLYFSSSRSYRGQQSDWPPDFYTTDFLWWIMNILVLSLCDPAPAGSIKVNDSYSRANAARPTDLWREGGLLMGNPPCQKQNLFTRCKHDHYARIRLDIPVS